MTEGRRRLLELLQVVAQRTVAGRCGVRQSTVSRWASGETRPGSRARALLAGASRYAIPVEDWDRPARPRRRPAF